MIISTVVEHYKILQKYGELTYIFSLKLPVKLYDPYQREATDPGRTIPS